MNTIPIVSQIRSLALYSKGNKKEAMSCADEFSSKAIGVSQVKSLICLFKNQQLNALFIQQQFMQKSNLIIQISMLICFVLVPFAELFAIRWVGFRSDGIASHSLASIWMASFHGNIPKNSMFSSLQTIGRTGILPFFVQVIPQVLLSCLVGVGLAICFHQDNSDDGYKPINESEEEVGVAVDDDRCPSPVSVD